MGARSKRDTHELSPTRAQPLLRVEADKPNAMPTNCRQLARCPSFELPRAPSETRTSSRDALTVRTGQEKPAHGFGGGRTRDPSGAKQHASERYPTHGKAKAGGDYAPPALPARYLFQRPPRPKHLAGLTEDSKQRQVLHLGFSAR